MPARKRPSPAPNAPKTVPPERAAALAAARQDMVKRTRIIKGLRIAVPAFGAVVLAAFAGTLVYHNVISMIGGEGDAPGTEVLVQPRMLGQDDKGRPFIITAATATRDDTAGDRILLEKPILVTEQGKPEQTRMTAGRGVYNETDGRLNVDGGVNIAGPRGAFDTASSIFDSRTGEITGQGAVRGEGSFGTITAGSYVGENNGKRIIYKGGVRARLKIN